MNPKVNELFHTKFVRGGRDPKIGVDCQGLFLSAMKCFGNEVKDTDTAEYATEVVSGLIEEASKNGKWQKVDKPEPGCAVAIALDPDFPDKAQHLGVYIGEGKFIHILEGKRGVLVTKIEDRFFKGKIRGFYRFTGNGRK